MAVYRRGYQRYQGELTGRWSRFLVLPRYSWEKLFQQRLVVVVLVIALFWPLGCAGFIYVANHKDLIQSTVGSGANRLLEIDSSFFIIFMNAQSIFAVLLAALAGPSLIAPDLTNNALPLYFSRPMTQVEYVLARLTVLVGLLSPVTWIPGLILFGMQSGMAGWSWFAANLRLGAGLLFGFLAWILLVALVALASSAYVKWRLVAGALVLGFFFVLAGASHMINGILRVTWGSAINPSHSIEQIWRTMLGAEALEGPSATDCASLLGLMGVLLVMILWRKLRPVEVVS